MAALGFAALNSLQLLSAAKLAALNEDKMSER